MDKIIKLNSIQAGPFTPTNNRIDFDIPEGNYDLSKSYVNLRAKISTGETGGLSGIHQIQLGTGANAATQNFAVSLIKNCSLVSAKAGTFEYIREVRLLKNTLKHYTQSDDKMEGEAMNSSHQVVQSNLNKSTVLAQLTRLGDQPSQYVNAPIKIPLSDLFSLGNMANFPADKVGKTRVHLEYDPSQLQVYEDPKVNVHNGNATANLTHNYVAGENYTNGTGGNVNLRTVTLSPQFYEADEIPFWVGCKIRIDARNNAVAFNNTDLVISSINYLPNSQRVQITTTTDIVTVAAAGVIDQIKVSKVMADPTQTVLDTLDAEIVLHKNANKSSPDAFEYRTWTTEQYDGLTLQDFRRSFEVEPECVNLFVMFPDNNRFLSIKDNLESYRISLNNVNLTDRNVHVERSNIGDPLYIDELNKLFLNSDLRLNNLVQASLEYNPDADGLQSQADAYADSERLIVVGTPLPLTPNPKQVELDLQTSAPGVGKITLFKQVERMVSV